MDISRGLPPSRRPGLRRPGCVHELAFGRNRAWFRLCGSPRMRRRTGGSRAGRARAGQAGGTGEADSMKSFRKEQLGKVRTKIVATVGPASSDPAILRQMVEAGVDVFRLNFSHGTHEEHTAQLRAIRRIAEEIGDPDRGLAGPVRPEDPAGGDPGRRGLLRPRRGVRPGRRARPGRRSAPPDLLYPHAAGRARGRPDRCCSPTARWRWRSSRGGPGRARLKVTLPGLIRSHQGINVPGRA